MTNQPTPAINPALPTPPVTPILDAAVETYAAVMALTLDPHAPDERGLVRVITKRQGDPSRPGFVDHSELRLIERRPDPATPAGANAPTTQWHVTDRLAISGLEALIATTQPPGSTFLGPEDPDLFLTGDGILHLFFTIPFRLPGGATDISLGHATGSDLFHLAAQDPVLHTTSGHPGFKEVCIGPVNQAGRRFILTESSDSHRGQAYSTIALATAPADLTGPWRPAHVAAHPRSIATEHARHATHAASYDWCAEHVSPAFLLPAAFAPRPDGLLIGVMNARSRSIGGTFGKFLPGLFLFDPETAHIPWIDPQPLFDDSSARNIIFVSDFELVAPGAVRLYAHLDDERIVAYDLAGATLNSRLTQ
jgi:hypothetical protein